MTLKTVYTQRGTDITSPVQKLPEKKLLMTEAVLGPTSRRTKASPPQGHKF